MLNTLLPEYLTELERTVIEFLLQGDSVENAVLMQQLASSSLESRERNGYGIYTNFEIPDGVPRCARDSFELGDVSVVLSGQLCGFILFVRKVSRLAETSGHLLKTSRR
jgi:hypothetical protein